MSKTVQVPAGTMSNDVKPVQPELQVTTLTASLTEILGTSDPAVRGAILDSFMSSINLALLSQCRAEVFYGTNRPLTQGNGIDAANERLIEEQERKFDNMFASISGNKERAPAIDVATALGGIRSYCLEQQMSLNPNREPRPLYESLSFMLDQMPTTSSANDSAVKAIALVTKKSVESIVAAQAHLFMSERQKLIDAAPDIIALGNRLSDCKYGDEQSCEEAFDKLPAITQINVFTSACNAIVSAYNRAFKQVLRGKAAAAGDMVLAEDLYHRAVNYRTSLLTKHASEVDDFESRGFDIKELKRIA